MFFQSRARALSSEASGFLPLGEILLEPTRPVEPADLLEP